MSLNFVEDEVRRFLVSELPEVLAINGNWGVGKTFAWQQWVRRYRSEIALKQYGYVSLFGIENLTSLKLEIAQSVASTSLIGKEMAADTLWQNRFGFLSKLMRQVAGHSDALPYLKDMRSLLASLSFRSASKSILCIDDFERKSASLRTREIFGLVCHLRDQMNCKVVLILNPVRVGGAENGGIGDTSIEYRDHYEKTVDYSIEYRPTPKEAVSIALSTKFNGMEKLAQFCEELSIDNIRLIKRIERLAIIIIDELTSYSEGVLNQALQSLVLLVACKYSSDEEKFPPYEFLFEGLNVFPENLDVDEILDETPLVETDKGKETKEESWRQILAEYGTGHLSDFGMVMRSFVDLGYLDRAQLQAAAQRVAENYLNFQARETIQRAWAKFDHSFVADEEAVIPELMSALADNIKAATLSDINKMVGILLGLSEDKKADDLVQLYVSNIPDEQGSFDLENHTFRYTAIIPKVREAFEKKHKKQVAEETVDPVQTLISIRENKHWSPKQVAQLTKYTASDYLRLFKGIEGEDLTSMVQGALIIARSADSRDTDLKLIGSEVRKALQTIAKESRLNAMRVSRYGVSAKTDN